MDIVKEGRELEKEYTRLIGLVSSPEVIKDSQQLQKYSKTLSAIEPRVRQFKEYMKVNQELQDLDHWVEKENDEQMLALAREELTKLRDTAQALRQNLEVMLKPREKEEEGNVIMEIRAGTGGEEAALFARDLFRMYERFAEMKNWKVEIMHSSCMGRGGFKEVVFAVEGEGVWKDLKYESGTHRVQRIPETESGGRIHTSTATVAVLPEVGEVEVEIDQRDLDIGTYRASGPGGQHVNVTDSAVRIIHKPTGIKVQCQDERSQHQNKARALRILKAKLLEKYKGEKEEEISRERKDQIGTGERSEKIRTYNFPQNRVTDHRINLTIHKLVKVLDGELEAVINPLKERADFYN